MDPRHLFMDSRLTGMCVYCGDRPATRDHVPSKVLLDEPYPAELPVVGACTECNSSFSLDEQYLACFVECVICGAVEPEDVKRDKVARILTENPALQKRIQAAADTDLWDNLIWTPEMDRVRKVVLKLARGHAAYELYPVLAKPTELGVLPIASMSEEERDSFETSPVEHGVALWPEIGSRAFLRTVGKAPDPFGGLDGWVVVQPGRYRYSVVETGGILVRMVLSEYLACLASWE